MDQLEPLRGLVTIAIKDATGLIARLKALDGALTALVPSLAPGSPVPRSFEEAPGDAHRDVEAAGQPEQ